MRVMTINEIEMSRTIACMYVHLVEMNKDTPVLLNGPDYTILEF